MAAARAQHGRRAVQPMTRRASMSALRALGYRVTETRGAWTILERIVAGSPVRLRVDTAGKIGALRTGSYRPITPANTE